MTMTPETNFRLFTSNNLSSLGREYAARRLAEPRRFRQEGFFAGETICVATQGMATWLEHFLVEQGHVVANLHCAFIRNVIDEILAAFKEGDSRYKPELFQEEVLIWRIYRLLEDPAVLERLPVLGNYLSAEAAASALPVRRYQLSRRLAQLYYNYIAFVPEMLHPELQRNPKEPDAETAWQVTLWGMLCDRGEDGCRIVSPAQALLEFVRPGTALRPGFYHPVTFFGVSAMAPYFLVVLKKLATVQPVNFYYLNHCDELWDNVKEDRNAWKKQEEEFTLSNPILVSDGLQGSEFFKAVLDLSDGIDWEEHPGEAPGEAGGMLQWDPEAAPGAGKASPAGRQPLLRELQQRILHNSDEATGLEMLPAGVDDSITIHRCFNEVREVEALHNCLLRLFDEYHSRGECLNANDVIVMAPDIAAFAPAIQAVFDQGPLKRHYCISDRSVKQANLLAESFLNIIGMPKGSFEVSRVSRLLDSPPLRRRFGLADEDVAILREWLRRAGIRWGEDGRQRAQYGGFEEFSWQHGLDRMLLKLAVDGSASDGGGASTASFLGGLTPVDFNTGKENQQRLDGLMRLYGELRAFSGELLSAVEAGGLTIAQWRDVLLARRSAFFLADSDSAQEFSQLGRTITGLEASLAAAGYDTEKERLPYEVVLAAMTAALEAPAPGEPFLNGKITFCSLLPMRGIPRKVIALLGMDVGEFPRQNDSTAYNLMGRRKESSLLKYYDRSRSVEDRFTFLEALVSAQDYLLFFYKGQSDQDLEDLAPAAPLGELMEYLAGLREMERPFVVSHRLNAFDAKSFGETLPGLPKPGGDFYSGALLREFSYDQDCAATAAVLLAPAVQEAPVRHWREAYRLPLAAPAAWDGGRVTLTLEELERFLKDPATAYVSSRLGFPKERWEEEPLSDYEPFEVDARAKARLKRRLAEHVLEEDGEALSGIAQLCRCIGDDVMMPVGRLGEVALRQCRIGTWIPDADFRREWREQEKSAPRDFSLELGEIALQDVLRWNDTGEPAPVEPSRLPTLKVTVTGRFKTLPDGLRSCLYVASPNGLHLAGLYLKHLMVCAAGGDLGQEDAAAANVKTLYLGKPDGAKTTWNGCGTEDVSSLEQTRRNAREQLRRVAGLALLNRLYPVPLLGRSSWTLGHGKEDKNLFKEDLAGANAAWLFGEEEWTERDQAERDIFQKAAEYCYGAVGETKCEKNNRAKEAR